LVKAAAVTEVDEFLMQSAFISVAILFDNSVYEELRCETTI
jgi:hypothetical protein